MLARALLVAVVSIGIVGALVWRIPVHAQSDQNDREATTVSDRDLRAVEATISALQTSVAGQSTQIASLQTRLPSPTTAPATPALGTAPIPISNAFVVLYYYFVDDGKSTYVFGELQNVSRVPAIAPPIIFDFLDENGNSYGTDSVHPVYTWVPASGRMPFQSPSVMGGALRLGDWSSETVAAGEPYGDLTALDTSKLKVEGIPAEGSLDEYGVAEGSIHNTGDVSVGEVSVQTAIYDARQRFVGACWTLGGSPMIPPGKVVRFSVASGCGFLSAATESSQSKAMGPYFYRIILTVS